MWVSAEIISNILQSAVHQGFNETELLRKTGIAAQELKPENRIEGAYGIALWSALLDISKDPHLGIRLGNTMNFSVLGWLSPLITASPTIKDALNHVAQFSSLMGDMFSYEVISNQHSSKVLMHPAPEWLLISPKTATMATEHAMSLVLLLVRYLSGKPIQASISSFLAPKPKNLHPQMNEGFGQLRFSQETASIAFDAHVFSLPVFSANHLVYEQMLIFCENKIKELQEPGVANKIRVLLRKQPAYQLPKIADLADALHMSSRTLQRKLAAENVNFLDLVKEYQTELAVELLKNPNARVSETAWLLGYNSADAFTRSFKKRTGKIPAAFLQKSSPI